MFSKIPLTSMRVFESAARLCAFKDAAEELSVTPAAISHQVKYLEEWLGQQLFQRIGKGVVLTDHGKQLQEEIHIALLALTRSIQIFRPILEIETLVVTTFHGFASLWLIPRLDDFYSKYPEIQLKLVIENDLLDLRRNSGIDLAIRCTSISQLKLHEVCLMEERFHAYISPAYQDKLLKNEIILISMKWETKAPLKIDWHSWCEQAGLIEWLSKATFREFSDEHFALQAVLAGEGVVLASSVLVAGYVERGLLIPYRPDVLIDGARYRAVCVPSRERHPPVSIFLNWLRETADSSANLV